MAEPLKVMILDDRAAEAETMSRELRRAGFDPDWERVETRREYLARLDPDLGLILANCALEPFTALEALRVLRQRSLDVPFIVVAEPAEREAALECLRHGADDYLDSDRLPRLGPAVRQALRARRLRDEQRREQRHPRVSAHQWQATFDAIRDPVLLLDAGGRIVRCNQATFDFVAQPRTELVGRRCCELLRPGLGKIEGCPYVRALESMERESLTWQHAGRWLEVTADPMVDEGGFLIGFVLLVEDITEQKQVETTLEQRVLELTLLNEVGNQITRALGLESVLENTVEIVQRSFGYHHVAIFALDQARETLIVRAIAGRFADILPAGFEVGLHEGIIGWAARRAETVVVNDVASEPRYKTCFPDQIATRSELSVPLRSGGGVVGVLDVQSEHPDAFTQSDVLVTETLADQLAVAMENARLYGAECAARQQLRALAGYLQEALEEERTHIAREIHDEFGQMMTGLRMDLSWLVDRLPRDRPELLKRAGEMSDAVDACVQAIRRVSTELRPGVLDDLGLPAAIEWQTEQFTERTGVRCELHLDQAGEQLDRREATALFRILQEALTNVSRHADASLVRIDLQVTPDDVTLTVRDDGRGVTRSQLASNQSLGLMGMRERARSLGGDVAFEGCPNEGTSVTASIPRRHQS